MSESTSGTSHESESGARPSDSGESSAAAQIREIIGRFRLPGLNVNTFVEARQADIDAVARATSVAFAGAQTITQKQAELLKTALGELSDALKSRSANASGPEGADVVKKQSELAGSALSRALAGMKEMAEAAHRSQSEIFDIALDRVRANAEQIRTLFTPDKR
jgi:phasin family protein